MSLLVHALLCLVIMTVQPLSAAVFATFNTPLGSTSTGSLAGVGFTITGLTSASLSTADLSGANFSADPGPASQQVLQHGSANDWTITFDSPIPTLEVYAIFWRPAGYAYSLTPTIASGLTNSSIAANTLTVGTGVFGNGIITFSNVTTLSLDTTLSGGGVQQLQFAVPGAAIPEPATAPLLAVSFAFLIWRCRPRAGR
jgi:hypothetical protein